MKKYDWKERSIKDGQSNSMTKINHQQRSSVFFSFCGVTK